MTDMLPADTGTSADEPPLRDDLADYGARVEVVDAEHLLVEVSGMDADAYRLSQAAVLGAGWGPIPLGRVDPLRPDIKPHKTLWDTRVTGYDGIDRTAEQIADIAERIAGRIASGRERGMLNSGARVPAGVIGLDVDDYGDKHGLATIERRTATWGELPPTYRLTARGFADGSGILLYRVPPDWIARGEIPGRDRQPSHVEIVQRHHRYCVAPGGLHHTGAVYRVYNERSGAVLPLYWMPSRDALPELPAGWLDGLRARNGIARGRGRAVTTPADVAAFADERTFNQYPDMLARVVRRVREATGEGQTRNAYRDALWLAAHEADAGYYPWTTADAAIRAAAIAAYAERGRTLDARDYARCADTAIRAVLEADPYADIADEWADDDEPPERARRRWPLFDPRARATYRPMKAAR